MRDARLLFGGMLLAMLASAALLAPWLAPRDPAEQRLSQRLLPPQPGALLGTDHLGRDTLSRLLFGARAALRASLPAVAAAMLSGIVLGALAGLSGGWLEGLVLVCADVLQAFPSVLLALALLALTGPSEPALLLALGLAFLPGYIRIARAQTSQLSRAPFVEASRALGAGPGRIVLRHIAPNLMPIMIVLLALDLPAAITLEAGLSYLGLGTPPPAPTWGGMLADGFARIRQSPWPVLWPCLALMLSTLGVTLFGEAIRERT